MHVLPSLIMNFCEVFSFFPSLFLSVPSLELSSGPENSYRSDIKGTTRFWLHYTKQKIDLCGNKGEAKKCWCPHDHHVDFQHNMSNVCKTLKRNKANPEFSNASGSPESRERCWFSVVTLDLQWCSWVKNLATYLYIKAAGCNYLHHEVCLLLF